MLENEQRDARSIHITLAKREAMKIFIIAIAIMAFPLIGHSTESPLKGIDVSFIKAHLLLPGIEMIHEKAAKTPVAEGCSNSKRFSFVYRSTVQQVIIALCESGIYGPQSIQSTIEDALKPAASRDNTNEPHKKDAKPTIGTIIPLSGNRSGRAFWLPLSGHGFVLIPTAIAETKDGRTTIFIQSDFDVNSDDEFLKYMAALLRAVDAEL